MVPYAGTTNGEAEQEMAITPSEIYACILIITTILA